MRSEIEEWINNGCDYASGCELYQKHGRDHRLKRFVFLPSNNIASIRDRLKASLAEIAGIDLLKPTPPPRKKKPGKKAKRPVTPEQSVKKELPDIDYTKLPEDLKILTVDRIGLWHRANEARYKLHSAKSDEERFELVLEEMNCRRENELIWEELIHFNRTGKILGKHQRFKAADYIEKIKKKSKAELFKMLQNLPSYRSKVNSQIKKLQAEKNIDEAEILKKKKLLEKYDMQEREIKRLLEIDE